MLDHISYLGLLVWDGGGGGGGGGGRGVEEVKYIKLSETSFL